MGLESLTLIISKRKSEEIYILPNVPLEHNGQSAAPAGISGPGADSIELVVLVNNLTSQEVSAYTTTIHVDIANVKNSKDVTSTSLENVRNALLEAHDCSFEIRSEGSSQESIVLWSVQKERIGIGLLLTMTPSAALQQILAVKSSNSTRLDDNRVDAKLEETKTKLAASEAALRNLTIEKNKMEDFMYRAFYKCLNTKKDRIKQLAHELEKSGRSASGPTAPTTSAAGVKFKKGKARAKIVETSGSETGSDIDVDKGDKFDESSSEYNADTDVEIDNESSPVGQSKPGSRTHNLKSRRIESESEQSDSLNDSFPIFPVSRKLRSTANQLKLTTQTSKRTHPVDEIVDDELSSPVEKLRTSHVQQEPKIINLDDDEVEDIYDCDRLMDEI